MITFMTEVSTTKVAPNQNGQTIAVMIHMCQYNETGECSYSYSYLH